MMKLGHDLSDDRFSFAHQRFIYERNFAYIECNSRAADQLRHSLFTATEIIPQSNAEVVDDYDEFKDIENMVENILSQEELDTINALFDAADKNGDGVLSLKEWKKTFKGEFDDFDISNDEHISKREFQVAWAIMKQEMQQKQFDKKLQKFKKNAKCLIC